MTDTQESACLRRYWVSWWLSDRDGSFELSSPWWVSVESNGPTKRHAILAAILAENREAAYQQILDAFDKPPRDLVWRFLHPMPADWSPFSELYRRAEWMEWSDEPETVKPVHGPPLEPGPIEQANRATEPPDPETVPEGWPEPTGAIGPFLLYSINCSVCGQWSTTCRDYTAGDNVRRLVCLECMKHRGSTGQWPKVKP